MARSLPRWAFANVARQLPARLGGVRVGQLGVLAARSGLPTGDEPAHEQHGGEDEVGDQLGVREWQLADAGRDDRGRVRQERREREYARSYNAHDEAELGTATHGSPPVRGNSA
jgi:hypothetical protein